MSKREWIRDDEFAEICEAVAVMDIKEVCKLFGRNEVSLVNKLKKNGYEKRTIFVRTKNIVEEKKKTKKEIVETLKQDGYALQFIEEQTPELCMIAVKQDGRALEYVKNKTLELCMMAVKQDSRALQFIPKQAPELCMKTIKEDASVFYFVENQTNELCISAINENWRTLEYVRRQTPELCIVAIKQNPYALKLVHKQIFGLCLEAVRHKTVRNDIKLRDKIIKYCIKNVKTRERIQRVIKELND